MNELDKKSNLTNALNKIVDYLKSLTINVPINETIYISIPEAGALLSIFGGYDNHFACDVCIHRNEITYQEYTRWSNPDNVVDYSRNNYADGAHRTHRTYKSIRDLPSDVVRAMVLNWKEIKHEINKTLSDFVAEEKSISEFEI